MFQSCCVCADLRAASSVPSPRHGRRPVQAKHPALQTGSGLCRPQGLGVWRQDRAGCLDLLFDRLQGQVFLNSNSPVMAAWWGLKYVSSFALGLPQKQNSHTWSELSRWTLLSLENASLLRKSIRKMIFTGHVFMTLTLSLLKDN